MALFLKLCFLIIPLISISYKSFYFGIEIAYIECRKQIAENIDKAKPRVIVGRKATGPTGIAGLPKGNKQDRITLALSEKVIRFLFSTGIGRIR